jgi:zinc transporter 2
MQNNTVLKKSRLDIYKIPKKDDNTNNYYKLVIVIVMSFVFIAGEIFGGIMSHSISVISDAAHLITDLIGFIISFVSLYYSSKSSDHKISFGFHRMEVIGALANLFIIWIIAIFLFYEASVRIINK